MPLDGQIDRYTRSSADCQAVVSLALLVVAMSISDL